MKKPVIFVLVLLLAMIVVPAVIRNINSSSGI